MNDVMEEGEVIKQREEEEREEEGRKEEANDQRITESVNH